MKKPPARKPSLIAGYNAVLSDVAGLLENARRVSARTVNAVMTATYWEIGRRIVEHEQGGKRRAGYGEELLFRLSTDLSKRYGRGFSPYNLNRFREFYRAYPKGSILATVPQELSTAPPLPQKRSTTPDILAVQEARLDARRFPLPWSHYVLLLTRSRSPEARAFYETEALRGGWSVRQLARQIDTQFYERTALSRNKRAMLVKGGKAKPGDAVTPEEEIKDPLLLYVNYAREHWTNAGENPPVGLILCTERDQSVIHCTLDCLSNKVLAAEYRTTLPDEKVLAAELERERKALERRAGAKP